MVSQPMHHYSARCKCDDHELRVGRFIFVDFAEKFDPLDGKTNCCLKSSRILKIFRRCEFKSQVIAGEE